MSSELITKGNKTILFVQGKPFIAIAGEVHNSDSSSPEYMEKIWETADSLGMNTLLLPVTWEMVEPEEGCFDFSIPEKLIMQARMQKMKIIFLWFGSWKNAECMYAPEWVKTDLVRFKRGQIEKGKNKAGRKISDSIPFKMPYTTISYLCEEAMQADARAFSKLMQFIKSVDETENTVIAVQVENETGLLGAAREVSDEADALFEGKVPEAFVSYMRAHTDTMVPDVKDAVEAGAPEGSWSQVFGPVAEELFSAYYVARFVNTVAASGKREYVLPMAVNCWLDKGGTPGSYPTGGPVSRVHEVWHYCAPEIDIMGPDIYVPNFMDVCNEYTRRQAPLFIPESATHSYCAPRLVYTIGHYHAICYAPFGFDDIGKPFSAVQGYLFGMDVSDPALQTPQNFEEYATIGQTMREMMPLLGEAYGTNRLQAVSAESKESMMTFDTFQVMATFQNRLQPRTDGVCLCLQVSEQECYILGNACMVSFLSANAAKSNLDLLCLEEGHFEEGVWMKRRRLNGDEVAHISFNEPTLVRARFFVYE